MALSLQVADGEDGTAVATISGSDPATTNTLYKARWTGRAGFDHVWTYGQLTWTAVNTRTGDGTITLAGEGYWLWNVVGTVAAAPAFASTYQPISDVNTLSLEERILLAVTTRIRSLALADIPDNAIIDRWVARRTEGVDPLPCVAVAVWGAETFIGGTNSQDDIGLAFAVALLDKKGGDDRANLTRDTKWREQVIRAFRFQRLAGIPEVMTCIPEPASIIDTTRFTGSDEICSLIVFRFRTRTSREDV